MLVVEVLLPSTENIDRREKLLNYPKLASLREYVLVSPDAVRVEVFRRAGAAFGEVAIYGAEDTGVELISVDAVVPLAEIYAGVTG